MVDWPAELSQPSHCGTRVAGVGEAMERGEYEPGMRRVLKTYATKEFYGAPTGGGIWS